MQMLRPPFPRALTRPDAPRPPGPVPNPAWFHAVFTAKAVGKGGVIRRAVRDVEREVGREHFIAEVRRRGFHLVECGGQFIVICNAGEVRILC